MPVRVEIDPEGGKVAKLRSPRTVRREVTLLSSIFNMARQERLIAENPCDFIRKAVKKKIPALRRERAMSVVEERAVLQQ